jgi:hypothetical protein
MQYNKNYNYFFGLFSAAAMNAGCHDIRAGAGITAAL